MSKDPFKAVQDAVDNYLKSDILFLSALLNSNSYKRAKKLQTVLRLIQASSIANNADIKQQLLLYFMRQVIIDSPSKKLSHCISMAYHEATGTAFQALSQQLVLSEAIEFFSKSSQAEIGKPQQGGFGLVQIASYKQSFFAVKMLRREKQKDQEAVDDFQREIAIHQQLKHPNIVEYYFSLHKPTRLVMESHSDFRNLKEVQCPSINIKKFILGEILTALIYLHEKLFAHLDLKLENVLITPRTENPIVKLCDFGFTQQFGEEHHSAGTLGYIAPEIAQNRHIVTGKEDIYAFAMLAFLVYHDISQISLLAQRCDPTWDAQQFTVACIHRQYRPAITRQTPAEIENTITHAWADDPNQRPTADMTKGLLFSTARMSSTPIPIPRSSRR